MKEFRYEKSLQHKDRYIINFDKYYTVFYISIYVGIEIEELKVEMKKFNILINNQLKSMYSKTERDAIAFCDYMNEKYIILNKLIGE